MRIYFAGKWNVNGFLILQSILGQIVHRPAKLDKRLARELKSLADPTEDPYETVIGKTMCTHDFYEGTQNWNYIHEFNVFNRQISTFP